MFGFAVARARYERQAALSLSGWASDYLLPAAVFDLGCAIAGVSAAAQIRTGTGSYEFRKVLIAGAGLTRRMALSPTPSTWDYPAGPCSLPFLIRRWSRNLGAIRITVRRGFRR